MTRTAAYSLRSRAARPTESSTSNGAQLISIRTGTANFELRFYENQTSFDIVYGANTDSGAADSQRRTVKWHGRSVRRHNFLVSNTDAHKWLESHLRGGALRSGKSNTNGNASSECDTHRYGNADCFTDCNDLCRQRDLVPTQHRARRRDERHSISNS